MRMETDAPLAPLTTLRLGGPASRLMTAETEADLIEASGALVLGGGSNVVIADAGWDGAVVRVATRGVELDGDRLHAQAGEPWDDVVAMTVAEGLAGFECLSGIPGLIGGTPIQNVGAYGQEVSETIESVRLLDRARAEVEVWPAERCAFSYRQSIFKRNDRYVILAVSFRLQPGGMSAPIRYAELARALGVELGESAPLAAVREAVLELRRGKGMVLDPADPDTVSAGSFFTNPILARDAFEALPGPDAPPAWPQPDGRVKVSAAWLIERAGFHKGYGNGTAGISSKHTLALVNRGGARTADLVSLAREVAAGVDERFGVKLRPEPVFIGHAW
jgi:UDP-N-acetylmuramate dehydrogenase